MDTEQIYQAILKLAGENKTPVPIDTICHEYNITREFLSSHLRILQMFHQVKITAGGKYITIINKK